MAELDTGIPSFRWVQAAIRDQKTVSVKLATSEEVGGRVRWQDTECICLLDEREQDVLLWRNAIAWMRVRT
ncbi:MAG: RNA-binding protein hfq [Cyanobacteria bacterium J06642_2]